MRTTVTLDADVVRLLQDEAHKRGKSFKLALNEAVRMALSPTSGAVEKRPPFVVRARPMKLRTGVDPTRLTEMADELEIDAFLATTARLRES